jgi:hypothetical protein
MTRSGREGGTRTFGARAVVAVAALAAACTTVTLDAQQAQDEDLDASPYTTPELRYSDAGDLMLTLRNELLIYPGGHEPTPRHVPYVGPALVSRNFTYTVSADGRVAAVAWSSVPYGDFGEARHGVRGLAVNLFRVSDGEPLSQLMFPFGLFRMYLSPDGQVLAVATHHEDDTFTLDTYAVATGALIHSSNIRGWKGSTPFVYPFSPDGQRLYIRPWDVPFGQIDVMDTRSGATLFSLSSAGMFVASHDGRHLYAQDAESEGAQVTFNIYAAADGTIERSILGKALDKLFFPEGASADRWVGVGDPGGGATSNSFQIWSSDGLVRELADPSAWGAALSPDGTEVAYVSSSADSVLEIHVLRVADGTLVGVLSIPEGALN